MKCSVRQALAMAALLFAATPASADQQYRKCIDGTSTNSGFAECGSAYLARADNALNAAWKRTFALATGQTKTDLLAEQRLWISFKEQACKFYQNGDWGREGQVLHFFGCEGDVIEKRAAALNEIAAFLSPR